MIDKWFLSEVNEKIQKRKRMVVLDPGQTYRYLIDIAQKEGYTVLQTDPDATREWQQVKEELFLRYEAEKNHPEQAVIFYVTRPKNQMSFLFDYCFTHGCIDFTYPEEWLKNKLYKTTDLQIHYSNKDLLTLAKLSVGKDLDWWKKILQNLEEPLSLETELLPFLDNPGRYARQIDKDVYHLFEQKLFALLGQPYSRKPPETLAKEVVRLLFMKLLNKDMDYKLRKIYHKWIDSHLYLPSLKKYIRDFKIDEDINIWGVYPDHCFEEIDKRQLKNILENFHNKSYVKEKLQWIKNRLNSSHAQSFIPSWWKDIVDLLSCDTRPLNEANDIQKTTDFYTGHFYKADRAIRNLYRYFINDETVIKPLQEYYEHLNSELLQNWFEHIDAYQSGQSGFLPRLMRSAEKKTAVIVGDGVRYEIARFVAGELSDLLEIDKNIMWAGIPSETEHNMSALYAGEGEIIKLHKDREKRLSELSGKKLTFKNLEAVNETENSDYLILTYKDIDSAGEKLQMGAIKLFSEFETVLIEKIQMLVKNGYEVHLVTDHGFVLTGLLSEADKIPATVTGPAEVHERYIRTVERQNNPDWLEFEQKYGTFNYVYVAKSHRPFKSVGVYGFSHGGITPQEVVIPNFVFKSKKSTGHKLKVQITNKNDLKEVTGEIFGVKIKATGKAGDLFDSYRDVQILVYADNINYVSSNIVHLRTDEEMNFEFSFNGKERVKVIVIDTKTKEQLDTCEVKKSSARDLGGLL